MVGVGFQWANTSHSGKLLNMNTALISESWTILLSDILVYVSRGVDEVPKWRLSREGPGNNAILFGYRGSGGVDLTDDNNYSDVSYSSVRGGWAK